MEGLIVTPKTQPPPRPSAIALSPPTAAAAAAAAALRNETKSPQTISKDNAFIKTYSRRGCTNNAAEPRGGPKSTNDAPLAAVAVFDTVLVGGEC